MVIHRLVLGDLQTNCYIWADEQSGNAIIIDAPANAEKIVDAATERGFKITDIILTHGHFDHILALNELKGITNATLSVFEKTPEFLTDRTLNLCHYTGADYTPTKPDRILYDGDVIDFYGNEIKVIHTPGHTSDSICLLNDKTLISGDTLFHYSVGRWDHPTGDMETELASITDKLMVLDDDVAVYPGHGFSTTIGKEREGNPYI